MVVFPRRHQTCTFCPYLKSRSTVYSTARYQAPATGYLVYTGAVVARNYNGILGINSTTVVLVLIVAGD